MARRSCEVGPRDMRRKRRDYHAAPIDAGRIQGGEMSQDKRTDRVIKRARMDMLAAHQVLDIIDLAQREADAFCVAKRAGLSYTPPLFRATPVEHRDV